MTGLLVSFDHTCTVSYLCATVVVLYNSSRSNLRDSTKVPSTNVCSVIISFAYYKLIDNICFESRYFIFLFEGKLFVIHIWVNTYEIDFMNQFCKSLKVQMQSTKSCTQKISEIKKKCMPIFRKVDVIPR